MATAPKNSVHWASNIERGINYGATAPVTPTGPSPDPESPRISNNNVSLPIGFMNKTRAQRRRHRKQRKQRKTRRNRRANRH